MLELGLRSQISGAEGLLPIEFGRDTKFPELPDGHYLVCGFNRGLGESLSVCQSLADVTDLYERFDNGGAISIIWYTGSDEMSTIT